MPTFKFLCDRGLPGTSCMPMLVALGAASLGFEVAYGRTDPCPFTPGRTNMMPDFLPGVDVVRPLPGYAGSSPSSRLSQRTDQGSEGGRVIRILDIPLAPGAERAGDGEAVDCLVAGSLSLSRLKGDPAPIRIACDAIGRNGLRRSLDDASSSWRIDVPTLTPAETASLLRGAPLPRPMATAHELARTILVAAWPRHMAPSANAWPTASRRPAEARNWHRRA